MEKGSPQLRLKMEDTRYRIGLFSWRNRKITSYFIMVDSSTLYWDAAVGTTFRIVKNGDGEIDFIDTPNGHSIRSGVEIEHYITNEDVIRDFGIGGKTIKRITETVPTEDNPSGIVIKLG